MKGSRFYFLLLVMAVLLSLNSCKSGVVPSKTMMNSDETLTKPYLILVSLDGFRWDYVEKYKPPYLSAFIKSGVNAESLIPAFPSKTFPNHYSIATGMYPDKHGLVGNTFYSIEKDQTYSIGNRTKVQDGSFYKGTPIWVQASKEDMVTASFFFVGSEADIQGVRPTYYRDYDGSVPNETRVEQVLDWLALPVEKRPHLITLYFSDMDDVGHKFGPSNDDELSKKLKDLDENLGALFKGVEKSGLPVNIMIVSDHGMADVSTSNFIPLDDLENKDLYKLVNNGAIVNLHANSNTSIETAYQYLKKKEANFKVYKTENTVGFEYMPKNKDWGSIQIIPDLGYYFSSQSSIDRMKSDGKVTVGVHGYDPKFEDMQGIFYANGPAFKAGLTVPKVRNIHIYPIMCKILGLDTPKDIDGKLSELKHILK